MENKIFFNSYGSMITYIGHHFSYLGNVKHTKEYTDSYSVIQFYNFKMGYMRELQLNFKVVKENNSMYWVIERITL